MFFLTLSELQEVSINDRQWDKLNFTSLNLLYIGEIDYEYYKFQRT